MNNKILSIIPAREGSKGLKNKNIINLIDKPLIAWTIEASLKVKFINKTIVSSDSEEILNISKKYGANIIKRPKIISQDETNAELVVFHVLNELKKKGEYYDYLIYLQPTSPLRSSSHINSAIKLFFEKEATSLISVTKLEKKYLKLFFKKSDGYLGGISSNNFYSKNRQSLPQAYLPNGAIYIVKTDSFILNNGFISDKTIPFCMSEDLSLDIDTLEDLIKVQNFLKNKLEKN